MHEPHDGEWDAQEDSEQYTVPTVVPSMYYDRYDDLDGGGEAQYLPTYPTYLVW